ncbi:hypothetical protein ACQEVG_33010 [Streptomyces sp. CA-135486]|uniref:hypothetical protein n=1 Tax=Streptomyces sp. CA-135486 TaxID=3240049 RepID=UPI003D92E550
MAPIATGTRITATDADGRVARGTVISRSMGANGGVLAYEVANPVTGRVAQVYPDTYTIEVR